MFGDEDRQRPLLHTIDASQDPSKIHNNIKSIVERIKYDKAHRRGFLVEIMAFKLKAMFEAKMKAMIGTMAIEDELDVA